MEFVERLLKFYYKYKAFVIIILVVIMVFLIFKYQFNKEFSKINNSNSSSNGTTAIAKNELNTEQKEGTVSKSERIKEFVDFCNNADVEKAYNMLSENCQKTLYANLNEFKINYYNSLFKSQKIVDIDLYENSTYRVAFSEDPISTGKLENKIDQKIDYISVDDDYKLNISSFIKIETINSKSQNSYAQITVLTKQVFIDHEIYLINVKNLMMTDIYIDDVENSQLIINYSNGNKNKANMNEYSEEDLRVLANSNKNISIRVDKSYSNDIYAKSIYFQKIKINNKLYYDSNSIVNNGNSNDIMYEQKESSYPDSTSMMINL